MELKIGELSTASYWLLGIVALYLVIIVILLIVEQTIRKKGPKPNDIRMAYYRQKIEEMQNATDDNQVLLEKINILARQYLKEALDTDDHLEYSELAEFFREKEKILVEHFCNEMVSLSYAGEDIDRVKIQATLRLFRKIIAAEPIPSTPESSGHALSKISHLFKPIAKPITSGNSTVSRIN